MSSQQKFKAPEQPKKPFLFTARKKKEKRNKSGFIPALYSQLTEEEKQPVLSSMAAYNSLYGDKPYFEPEQYYQQIYKQALRLYGGVLNV